MLLTQENNLDSLPSALYSFTSTNISSGVSLIPVKNVNSFLSNYAIQLGRTGEEQSEIVNVSSVGGTALTSASALRFSHPIDTPIFSIHYDSIVFERSISGTSGTAEAFATTPITPD